MTKKCTGCGIVLQDKYIEKDGYTPKMSNDLCQRCFQLKNYGKKKNANLIINNNILIDKINQKKAFVIFIVDFLNIYNSVIEIYKKINCQKVLVITKSDIIPKNIVKNKVVENIKKIYGINEPIYLTSIYDNYNNTILKKIIDNNSKILFAGFTNAGKSSLINKLIGSDLTVSKISNTTLDFVTLKINDTIIYDTPGFNDNFFYDEKIPNKKIKVRTYQLQSKYYLMFNDIKIATDKDNSFSFYIDNNIEISKRKKDNFDFPMINIGNNIDLIIKGIGFINIKKEANIYINVSQKLLEVRPSMIGGSHE